VIFLYAGKTDNLPLLGVFRVGLDHFDPFLALLCAQDNLGIKKVLASLKNPSKWPTCALP
jgi:hypothetical protein